MSKRYLISQLIVGTWMYLAMAWVFAANPVWTLTPLTATKVTVAANDSTTIQYQITNQSKKTHTLFMRPVSGITQVTTAGNCPFPFVLGYLQSCILTLTVNGNGLNGNVFGGPVVCQQGNPNQCYQPSRENALNITRSANIYSVGGSVFGLSGSVVLVNNGGNPLTLNTDGTFRFSEPLPAGTPYSVTVQTQPSTQTCSVTNGNGIVSNGNVNNIIVSCSVNTRTVGGTLSGLAISEFVVLQNNGGDNLTLNSDGTFTFTTPIAQGSTYNITVLTQPATQICTVSNNSGTAGTTNITNIQVFCSDSFFTVGGTLSGLSGTVILQNNGTDNLSLSSNGPFTFSTPVAQTAPYNVTILTQPSGQTCVVTNGSGNMGSANVTNVGVTCTTNITTLTAPTDFALSVTGLTEYGVSGTPSSGIARTFTITNTGSYTATNFAVTLPTWPSGTTSSTTCGSTLAAGSSCTVTITPGNTATSNGTVPCSNGTAPIPNTIQITADNASTITTDAVILSYACVYQGGFVYAFDDTTPNTNSVGGKVLLNYNLVPAYPDGVIWSSNGNGDRSTDVAYDIIYGVSQTSTTSTPFPSTNQVPGQVACNGRIDGVCNSNNINIYYQNYATNAPINLTYYAAGLCTQTLNGYADWYLPSVCELGYERLSSGTGCGTAGTPLLQNAQSSLVEYNNVNLLVNPYWSSTQVTSLPDQSAWSQNFNLGNSSQLSLTKNGYSGVRCSRVLTY